MKRILAVWLWFLLAPGPVVAAPDDPDQRLFQAQLAMAQKGDAFAQYYLGEMYEHGLGTAQNLPEAFTWYEKSAAQKNRLAQTKLAKRKEIEGEAAREHAALEAAARAVAAPPPASTTAAKPDNNEWWRQQEFQKQKAQAEEKEKERKRAAIRALVRQKMQDSREAFE
jgi:TPR repeat protein